MKPYGTARDRAVNFGDRTPVRADQRKVLADISVDQAQPFTLYVTARIEPATPGIIPLVHVEWGNGGASVVAREHRVFRRLRVPLVASTIKVNGRLVDAAGAPPPAGSPVTAHFAAFVAPGNDGQTLRNTTWVSQHGAQGLASEGPEQILTVQGYPAAPGARWLMLFDAKAMPAAGAFPAMAIPARRSFRLTRSDTQGFANGVFWAASSTPILFTFDSSADLRVDVEVLT